MSNFNVLNHVIYPLVDCFAMVILILKQPLKQTMSLLVFLLQTTWLSSPSERELILCLIITQLKVFRVLNQLFFSVGSPVTRSTAHNQNVVCWCVVGESYRIHACIRAKDILHKSAECANRIRPSALHVINSTNTRASLEVVKLVKLLVRQSITNKKTIVQYNQIVPVLCIVLQEIVPTAHVR